MGSKRGSVSGSATGAAVLEAAEESYAPAKEWPGGGPAPAGALQRGRLGEDFGEEGGSGPHAEEKPYVPRRGSFAFRLRGMPRSVGGKVLAGVVLFGVLGVTALAVAGVRYYLLHDDRFVVTTSSDIQISGNEHLTRGQILSVFGADLERNIFKVPLAERRADLERLPWVAHATVMRLLPNQLRIAVTERVPVAFVRQGTQIGLVDAAGVLLDMPAADAGEPSYSFPVLTGLAAGDSAPARAARMDVYRKFMKELAGGGEKITQSLSEVDVSNPEDVKALIASGGMDLLVHFGDEDFLARYQLFEQHVPEWKTQYPKLASADMRYGNQIVLEMAGGAAPPVETAGATEGTASTSGSEASAGSGPAAVHPVVKGVAKPGVKKAVAKPGKVSAALAAARKPAGGAQ